MSALLELQQAFAVCQARFVLALAAAGYAVTEGESYRPPEMAQIDAAEHKGIADSLHTLRLAKDWNVFKDGRLLETVDELRPAGELWKSMSTPEHACCWGGDFHDEHGDPAPDSDHFSFAFQGRK